MPITWLDILLLGVMLVSGLLAMIRGFMREILSITAWAAAAVATLLAYPRLLPLAKANISSDIVATGAVIGGVFLVTLLIVSIITVRFVSAAGTGVNNDHIPSLSAFLNSTV